jgi:hypothetical protein
LPFNIDVGWTTAIASKLCSCTSTIAFLLVAAWLARDGGVTVADIFK